MVSGQATSCEGLGRCRGVRGFLETVRFGFSHAIFELVVHDDGTDDADMARGLTRFSLTLVVGQYHLVCYAPRDSDGVGAQ